MAKVGCKNSETPESIDIQFDVDDCFDDVTSNAKHQRDRPSGSAPEIAELLLSSGFNVLWPLNFGHLWRPNR